MAILNKQIADATGGGRDSGGGEMLAEMMRMHADERRDLQQQMAAAQAGQTQAVQQQLLNMQQMIAGLANPAAAVDPLAALTSTVEAVSKIKGAFDGLVVDPNVSRQQAMEQLRIEGETELRRLELKDRLEEARDARENKREERLSRDRRFEGITTMVQDTLKPLVETIGVEKVTEFLGGKMGGNGNGNGAQPPPTQVGPPAGMGQTLCPNCRTVNLAPLGATMHTCTNCGAGMVPFPRLEPAPETLSP